MGMTLPLTESEQAIREALLRPGAGVSFVGPVAYVYSAGVLVGELRAATLEATLRNLAVLATFDKQ